MKKIFIFLLLLLSLVSQATIYYVAPTGSNTTGIGTNANPWQTIAYAVSRCVSGDIVHAKAGTYTLTAQIALPVGVSVEGDGVTSIIISNYATADNGTSDGVFRLYSPNQNTLGNQSISYLKLDGNNLTGTGAIFVRYRGGVSVHHCTIVNFALTGLIFEGENSWNSQPVAFSSGNQIYNNTITNCHGGGGGGNIRITGQTICSIHDNIVDGRTRSMQNSVTLSNNKATSIYNNTFYTLNNRGVAFNFVFEIWDTWGGLEINNNTFIGGGTIDLGGHYTYKGAYAFGASIHNNTFTLPALEVYNVSEVIAITVESWATLNDIYIYDNRITNFGTGIQVTFGANPGGTASNFYIYNNIFENIGYSDTQGGSSAIGFVDQGVAVTSWTNMNIINNVMKAGGGNSYIGIRYAVIGATTGLAIRNNIITGFGTRAINFTNSGGSLNNVQITNNIFYSNGATINMGVTPTNYTSTPNYTSNPLFVSATDFHLQAGSPAIGMGVAVASVTVDYAGNPYKTPPSIGVYESGIVSTSIPTVTTTALSNVTLTNAQSGGTITNTGNATITSAGICWSATSNPPTIADSKSSDYYGSSPYISYFGGQLVPGTTYRVRAYATNSVGTGYGGTLTFSTPSTTLYKVKSGVRVITVNQGGLKTITVNQ